MMGLITRNHVFSLALLALLFIGCSDNNEKKSNSLQTEQLVQKNRTFVMSEESKNRLRENAQKQIEERERIKKLNPQTEAKEEKK